MDSILNVSHVEKYYGSNKSNIIKAIDDISFHVDEGEFISIMGASGSGKTTLLNCISTIDTVSAGNIVIGGKNITELKNKDFAKFRRENLGFIFQDFNLLENLTIYENIALALSINKKEKTTIEKDVKAISMKLGISDIMDKYPHETSGGQKQRCACARAIINNPKIVLADEPTGSLDSRSATMLLETIKSMNESLKTTILMVTHDVFSASYSNRVLILKDGKIFNELRKGDKTRKQFFNEIIDVIALLGGDITSVL